MTRIDWENITNYIDSVGTTDTVFPFIKAQSSVKVTTSGANDNIIYTIGGQSGTLSPGQNVTVTGTISSMTLRSASGRQPFQVWATEAGTEKDETDTSYQGQIDTLTTSLAQRANFVFHEFLEKLLAGQVTKIKLIGDSITAGVGSDGYYDDTQRQIIVRNGSPVYETGKNWSSFPSWANLFRKYINTNYPTIDFFNAGVPGIETLEVVQTFLSQLCTDNEDVVFVMLGTNDRSITTLDEYKTNITTVLDYINQRCNLMIVMSPSPSLSDFADKTFTTYASGRNFGAREIDNVLTELCKQKGFIHISNYRAILDYAAKVNVKYSVLLEDLGSHPKTLGHKVMWQNIQQRFGFINDVNEWLQQGLKEVVIRTTIDSVTNTTLLSDALYQENSITYDTISSNNTGIASFPEGKQGTLITYKPAANILLWGKQEYHIVSDSKIYRRYWNGSNWSPWYFTNSNIAQHDANYANGISGEININTLATKFIPESFTAVVITSSNSTIASFPEGKEGTLYTYVSRLEYRDLGHAYQEYWILKATTKYRRYWTGSAWSSWDSITNSSIVVASLPTASAAYRGKFQLVQATAGTKDQLYVCRYNASTGSYEWAQITT